MADFDIKPASGTGNSLRLKNEAGNIVLSTNNATGASSWGTVAPKGAILQCLSVSKLDTFSHTGSTAYTTVTGLTQAITPTTTSNKILLQAQLNLSINDDNAANIGVRFTGGNSASYIGNAADSQQRAALHMKNESGTFYFYHFLFPTFTQYLDSPATTSEVTYGVQVCIKNSAGGQTSGDTVYVNMQGTDSDNAQHGRGASSFTVWEVQV